MYIYIYHIYVRVYVYTNIYNTVQGNLNPRE